MLYRYILLGLLLCNSLDIWGQSQPKAQLGPIYTDAQYKSWNLAARKLLSLQQGKIYALLPQSVKQKKIWGLDFLVFDKEMNFQAQTFIPLEGAKRFKVLQFLDFQDETYILLSATDPKSRDITLWAQCFDFAQMKLKGAMISLGIIPHLPHATQSSLSFKTSPNQTKLLIMSQRQRGEEAKRQVQAFKLIALDNNLKPLWEYEPEIDPKVKYFHFDTPAISNEGVAVWARQESKDRPFAPYQGQTGRLEIIAEGKVIATNWIYQENALIIDQIFLLSDKEATITCSGVVGINPNLSKGYFINKYSLKDGKMLSSNIFPIDFHLLTDSRNGTLRDLEVRLLMENANKGFLILMQAVGPYTKGEIISKLPVYGDYYLISTQANGEIQWAKQIPQSQSFSPLAFHLKRDCLDFFYHQGTDPEALPQPLPLSSSSFKSDIHIQQVQIDWRGNIKERPLEGDGAVSYGIWPYILGSLEGNVYLYLGFSGKNARFIKLTYE